MFARMIERLKELTPKVTWNVMMENVASMTDAARSTITRELRPVCDSQPYCIDAEAVGHINRPRLYWLNWRPAPGEFVFTDSSRGYVNVTNPSEARLPIDALLDPGVTKVGYRPFPTAVRWFETERPPSAPVGYDDCDEDTLEKWAANRYGLPPYHFKRELGVRTADGEERPPNANERERLHGFQLGHTDGYSEHQRISFLGNTFHCIVVAHLFSTWAVRSGYIPAVPTIAQLWSGAGYVTLGPDAVETIRSLSCERLSNTKLT